MRILLGPAVVGLVGLVLCLVDRHDRLQQLPAAPPAAAVVDRPWTERQAVDQVAELWKVPADQVERRLWDGTRVDLVHDGVAWEADRAGKWQEGIGQAVHYGQQLNLRPGLLLLVDDPAAEWRDLARAAYVAGHLDLAFRWYQVEGQADAK